MFSCVLSFLAGTLELLTSILESFPQISIIVNSFRVSQLPIMVIKVPPKSLAQQAEVDIRAIPLCIICAKEEEMGKVAEAFCLGVGDWFPSSRVIGHYTTKGVYVGSFKTENGVDISYFITCCSRQGIQTFGIEASALFTVIKPQYALLIGTCAAREGKGLR